jgi:hypothetical protein
MPTAAWRLPPSLPPWCAAVLRRCQSQDNQGNGLTGSFVVQVGDLTPPLLTQPPNLKEDALSAAGNAVTFPAPYATDDLDPSPAVSCSPASGSTFAVSTAVGCAPAH